MPDLITRERAFRNLATLTSPTAADNLAVDTAIRSASQAIESYCRRTFAAQQYDELYSGVHGSRLLLRRYPVISIERVATDPTAVLLVSNTSSSNQRATVKVTDTGLELVHVASGVTARNTLLFSSYATLTTLAAAITAIGSGWSGTVASPEYGNRPSADLRTIQGAVSAMNAAAELRIHVTEISSYEIDVACGILTRSFASENASTEPAWPGGVHWWRVIYTAGFETVPEDVQEACAQWAAAIYWATKRDPGLAQEAIVGAESRQPYGGMPPTVVALLGPYRVCQILS